MTPSPRLRPPLRWLPSAARIALGAIFVYLGAVKTLDPVGFLKLAREFDVVHAPLALNLVAAVLPWFEVFCGTLLVLGWKAAAAAALQLLLLVAFTGLVTVRALAVHQTGGIPFCSIRFDCGCGTGEVLICLKLIENTALMALAAYVARSERE